jgi:uncharacterized protein with HEPN domain
VRILHIIEAIEAALQFVSDRDRSELDSDKLLLFALIRAIEIVGEAAAEFPSALEMLQARFLGP